VGQAEARGRRGERGLGEVGQYVLDPGFHQAKRDSKSWMCDSTWARSRMSNRSRNRGLLYVPIDRLQGRDARELDRPIVLGRVRQSFGCTSE
jgi:hypothetical protein